MKNNYPTFYLTGICKLCFIVTFFLCFSQGVFAQTKGLIVVPATGSGASILDPNNDGYVSGSTAGFIASDSDESELPYVAFVFPGLEPTSDIENGPDCGFTDFVDSGGYDPALSYRDTTGNWLFRLRLGGIRPNAKSYSILLDIDGKFGNSGPDFDPDYTLANPGFEVEIVLGTKFGVYMYDVDGTPNCSPVIEYTGTDHYQKAIAYSEICDDPDYFLDFYVEAADLITMGITPDTPIRMAIVDNMAAKKSTVCNSSSASDVGGVGPCGSLANCYEQIIDNQGPCTLDQINAGLCLAKSECPSINDPINGGDTDISGNTSEADGTTIRVYKNSFLIGEVASIGGVWLLPGIDPLSSGDTINATAQAVDESVSHYDCNTNIVGAVCSAPVTDVIHCGKSISGTAPVAGATVNVYYNGILLTPTGGTVWTGSEITVDANPIGSSGMNTADNFLWKCVGTGDDTGCNASGAACLMNGVYTITVTEPGKCESSPVFLCIGTDQATSTPEILTSPITEATTSISGTIPSPDNIADIEVYLYIDGTQIDNATTTAGGVWSISNLSLKACNTITVKAIRPPSGSGNSTIYYCVSEADSVTVSGGVSGIPEILGTYCITDSIREVKGISGEVDGTIVNVFENGILEGSTTVTSGGWTLSGVSIAIGRTITATAIATGECKLESSASDAVVVSIQSTNAGLTITTEPIVEQVTSISGTGTDGDIITLFVDDFEVDGASAIVSGSAWTISELNDYDLYVGGIVTVKATTPGFCESLPSASKVVECIPPSDDLTVNPAKDTICSGSTVNNIDILNSEKYVIYQLYLSDKITPTGTSRLGTGGTITFTSGILTSSTDFRVKAIKLPPDGSCEVFLTDSVKVTVFDPAAPTVGAITQPDCATNTGTVALSGLPTQPWTLTASPGGSTITGSTANEDFSGLAADDTYIFTVTIDATGCTSGASGSAVVDAVFGAPSAPLLGAITQPDCATNTGTVALSGLPTQDWTVAASPGGNTITGSTANANFAGLAADNTYTFTVTIDASNCTSVASGSVVVDAISSVPSAPLLGAITQPDCATNTGTVALSGLPTQGWTLTASPGGSTITGSTTTANFAGLAADNTYSFTVTIDATSCTSLASGNAVVDAYNCAPDAVADYETTNEDEVDFKVPVLDNDTGGLTVSILEDPTSGGTVIVINDTLIYNPPTNWFGTDTIVYQICNDVLPTHLCDSDTVFITLTPVNDAPSQGNETASADEDTPVDTDNVLTNNSDLDGDEVSVNTSSLSPISGQGGAVVYNPLDSSFTYTPVLNFNGNDTIFYEVCDNGSPQECVSDSIFIVVSPENNPPSQGNETASADEDTPVDTDNVLDNNSDLDGDDVGVNTFSLSLISGQGGTVVYNPSDSSFTYTPVLNFNGNDTIFYEVCDNGSPQECVSDSIFIVVSPVNDAPSQGNETASANEDTPVKTDNVLDNNSDLDGDDVGVNTSSLSPISGQGGAVVYNPLDSSFTYTPVLNFNGNDTIFYEVCDNGSPQECISDSIFIVVSPVNNAPSQGNETASADEDTPVDTDNVLDNNSDLDGDDVSVNPFSLSPTSGQGGTVVYNPSDSSFTYTPVLNFNGNDTIFYEVCDNGSPQECVSDSIFIVVTPVNNPPLQGNETLSADEDTPVDTDNVLDNNSDLDGDEVSVNTSSLSPISGQGGTVVYNSSDSSFTYTPVLNFNGNDTIFYEVCDNGSPQECVSDSIFIVVSSGNNPPTAVDDSETINEDAPVIVDVQENDLDVDGDELTTSLVSLPTNGTVNVVNSDSIAYQPNFDFIGNDTVFYRVCDARGLCDTAMVVIVVEELVDPIIAVDDVFETTNGNSLSGSLVNNDSSPNGDVVINTTPIVQPEHGTLVINADGTFTYTPDEGFYGEDTFTYEICDAVIETLCSSAVVTIVSELDTDYDGIANNIDIDDDNDGIRDVVEGDGTVDTDSDGIPDSLDIDSDNDGIPDIEEGQAEGEYIAPLHVDTDNDGWDDAYDPDNSGIEFIPVDTDLDNKPDYRDVDTDNDGIPDSVEGHDANSDVKADVLPFGTDSDNDGLDDAYDSVYGWDDRNNSVGSNATLQDTNGDGVRDWRDNVPILPRGQSVLFIPNGFSPNGDNVNDYFIVDFAKQFPDMRIEIFNRWGNKVYEKEKYGNEDRWGVNDAWWDGRSIYNWTVGDERLPAGTYFYILEFNDGTTKPKAGSVFLNR